MKIILRKNVILDAATAWLEDKAKRDPTEAEKQLAVVDKHGSRGPIPDFKPENVTEAILRAVNWPVPTYACVECHGQPAALVQISIDFLCRECAGKVAQEISRV